MTHPIIAGKRIRRLPTRRMNDAMNFAQQSEQFGNRAHFVSGGGQFVVSVLNDSGDDLDEWSVLGLDNTLIDPADNESGFRAGPKFRATTPTHADHLDDFVLMLQPTRQDRIGLALKSGLINCRVEVNHVEHRYVRPQDNSLGLLETCGAGGGRIRWPFPFTATGEQWATVELTPFTGPAFGYLTTSLQNPSVSGSPQALSMSTADVMIWTFDSNGDWTSTEDEVTAIQNPWEQVSAPVNALVTFTRWGGKWMLTGAACNASTFDGLTEE